MNQPETPEDIPRHFADAWNAGDAAALAGLFAEDAEFVNVVGLWWHDRADIEKAHDYGLGTFFRGSNLSIRGTKIKLVGPDAATVHVRWRLSGQLGKDGKPLDDRTTIMMFVAERMESGWHVVAAQNTDVVPGKETYATSAGTLRAVDYRA